MDAKPTCSIHRAIAEGQTPKGKFE